MRKTKSCFMGSCRKVSLMVLVAFLISLGLAQAQELTEAPKNKIRPEIKAQIEALQQEVAEKGHTFTVGYNPAMEYTISQLAGLVVPKGWRKNARFEDMDRYLTATASSFDWRTWPGGNVPVRNQGSCGSCWAFGTVAPLETLIGVHCGKSVDLSEQYLVSCNQSGWGCQGGWFAHDYHEWLIPTGKGETDFGAVLETAFPYKAYNVSCGGPHAHPYKISDWRFVGSSNGVPTPAAIKQAIENYGPVSVAVCVGSKFQAYRSGIFNSSETCSGTVNHAVTLVGWNDDLGVDKGYWILKNSWGTGWGEGGYMRIRYGVSKVGFAANFVVFSGANCPDSAPVPFDCTGATTIGLGTVSGTTDGGRTGDVTYACSGQAEKGPRKVYKVTTSSAGDLIATLSNPSVDLDVFILKGCSPANCAAYGDTTASLVNAPAGTYYIVVDTKSGAAGTFNLTVSLARPLPDLSGSWIQMSPNSTGKIVYTTLKVNNTGNATAGRFRVGYYLSSDGSKLDKLLGTQTISSLVAGRTVYLYPRFSSSAGLRGKYLIAKVDYLNNIVEKDETNNVATGLVSLKR